MQVHRLGGTVSWMGYRVASTKLHVRVILNLILVGVAHEVGLRVCLSSAKLRSTDNVINFVSVRTIKGRSIDKPSGSALASTPPL